MSVEAVKEYLKQWGKDSAVMELTCEELFAISGARAWVDVCKDWRD